MNQFLFVVEVPPNKSQMLAAAYTHEWSEFVSSLDTIPDLAKKSTKIQLNAWLIKTEGGWHVLESLAANAKAHGLACSILQVDNAIELTNNKAPSRATVEALRI